MVAFMVSPAIAIAMVAPPRNASAGRLPLCTNQAWTLAMFLGPSAGGNAAQDGLGAHATGGREWWMIVGELILDRWLVVNH